MRHFTNVKTATGLMGVVLLAACAPLARADLNLSINGTDCAPVLTSATPNANLTCGGTITLAPGVTVTTFSTTGTQTAAFSQQLSSTGAIQNLTAAPVTISFGAGITNFSSPTIPPATGILDASTITLNETLGSATGMLTSCVDQDNALVPPDGIFCHTSAPGMARPNPTTSVTGSMQNGNTTFGTITALSAPFSLQQALTLTLQPTTSLNFTLTQVLTPVPEPASLALLGSGLLGLGLLLRRKTRAKLS